MKKIMNWLKNEESGQGMVEYGLVIAVVVIVIAAAFGTFGTSIATWFGKVANKVVTAQPVS